MIAEPDAYRLLVGDLAADVAAALVVVRAEVLVSHAGIRQQLVVDLQLGVAGGDLCFELAALAGPAAGSGRSQQIAKG